MKIVSIFLSVALVSFSSASHSYEVVSEKKDPPVQQEPAKPEKGPMDQALQKAKEASQDLAKTLDETRERRKSADYFALLNYSPLDLLIPSKQGLTLGLIRDVEKSWELEYLHGSVSVPFIVEDLGKMTDDRISLIGRSYLGGNSFNISYGPSYFDFSLHLGDQLLNRVTSGSFPSMDLVEIQSLGFNLAVGNRWTFKHNITFGVDWISWAQPVIVTNRKSVFLDHANNQQDKDDVEKGMKIMTYFPRLAFLKLQLGILF